MYRHESESLRSVSEAIRIRRNIKIKVYMRREQGQCERIIFEIPFYLTADPRQMETEISRDDTIKHLWSTFIKGQY